MKPQINELATRDFQEHTPKGNRLTREINRDAYNVTNTRKERVPNRAGIKKKNTGQGTSKERRYGSNMPRGSYASQMSGVAVLDRERAAFCAPQPVRKRTSLESEELPRRKKSKSEDWSGRATARATSPADGRRRSLDTDSVPAQKQRKKTTKEQDRCKIIKKALKKLGKK
ncbi:unnamed protein product [Oikopleura dioica]|uniref:Uncharacterized protein n=1 Tax=Oikopleura dioica TaxID=34765 RepID=E4Z375_OIKDI|nr:unnamed protein product [Oikopleura dioica]